MFRDPTAHVSPEKHKKTHKPLSLPRPPRKLGTPSIAPKFRSSRRTHARTHATLCARLIKTLYFFPSSRLYFPSANREAEREKTAASTATTSVDVSAALQPPVERRSFEPNALDPPKRAAKTRGFRVTTEKGKHEARQRVKQYEPGGTLVRGRGRGRWRG